jgi:hypothetical protein
MKSGQLAPAASLEVALHHQLDGPYQIALQPIAYPIELIPSISGINRGKIFDAIKRKELMARKVGRSTVIEAAELRRWIQSLPIRGREPAAATA